MTIVQWNIRGYRSNYQEMNILINRQKPSILCLQETQMGLNETPVPSGYSFLGDPNGPPRLGEGTAMLIRKDIAFHKIDINSNLKVMAIRAQLSKKYTVCNVYINPEERIARRQILDVYQQLPKPCVFLGDLNCRHPLWGDTEVNGHRMVVENVVSASDICVLNTGEPTRFNITTGSYSCIDMVLCSPDGYVDFSWRVLPDLYGSDQFLIVITEVVFQPDGRP